MNQPSRLKASSVDCLVIEIAEHQARAAAADLADFTGRQFAVRIVAIEDANFVAGAGSAAALDDQAADRRSAACIGASRFRSCRSRSAERCRVQAVRQRARAALEAPEMRKPLQLADAGQITRFQLGEQIDRMCRNADQERSTGLDQPVD